MATTFPFMTDDGALMVAPSVRAHLSTPIRSLFTVLTYTCAPDTERPNTWALVLVLANNTQLRITFQLCPPLYALEPGEIAPRGSLLVAPVETPYHLFVPPSEGGEISCELPVSFPTTVYDFLSYIRKNGLHRYRYALDRAWYVRGHRFWLLAIVTWLEVWDVVQKGSAREVRELIQWTWLDGKGVVPKPREIVHGRFLMGNAPVPLRARL